MEAKKNIIQLKDYTESHKIISQDVLCPLGKNFSLTPPNLLGKRMIALGVDIATIALIKTSLHGAYAIFVSNFLAPLSQGRKLRLIEGDISLHLVTFLIIYSAYFFYTTFVLNGKTLGKMTMGLRVIDENYILKDDQITYSLDLKHSFKRALGYLICYLSFGSFFIFNFSSEDKRGLPDYLSNSRTVSDDWLNHFKFLKEQNIAEVIYIDIEAIKTNNIPEAA